MLPHQVALCEQIYPVGVKILVFNYLRGNMVINIILKARKIMRIPHHLLNEETFESLVCQFVTEVEGSDFDSTPFEVRVKSAKELIEKGEIIILYSEMEEAPFLLTKSQCIERFKRVPEYLA